jgi:hypothetical protein
MGDIEQVAKSALERAGKITGIHWDADCAATELGPECDQDGWMVYGMSAIDSDDDVCYYTEADAQFIAHAQEDVSALARAVLGRGEVLRAVEWGHCPGGISRMCPVCMNLEEEGHAPGCALAQALKGESNG